MSGITVNCPVCQYEGKNARLRRLRSSYSETIQPDARAYTATVGILLRVESADLCVYRGNGYQGTYSNLDTRSWEAPIGAEHNYEQQKSLYLEQQWTRCPARGCVENIPSVQNTTRAQYLSGLHTTLSKRRML